MDLNGMGLHIRWFLLGASCVAGAAGILFYQYLSKRQMQLIHEVNNMRLSIDELRQELEGVRVVISQKKKPRERNSSISSVGTNADMFSTFGDDIDDDCYGSAYEESIVESDRMSNDGYENEDGPFIEIDALLDGSEYNKMKSLRLLQELSLKDPDNDEVLWRLAKANYRISVLQDEKSNSAKKLEYLCLGIEHGWKAVEVAPNSSNAHKWLAICVGSRSSMLGMKEKISEGHVFREHLEAAIAIDDKDPTLYHLLGRFRYEVASLSWLEQKLANSLFNELPVATLEDAIASLLRAEQLNTFPWKENKLFLAKCYLAKNNVPSALMWLTQAAAVECVTPEDSSIQAEIEKYLKKYSY